MADVNLRISIKRRWWASMALRLLYAAYWVAAHLMSQKQADAFGVWCIQFVAKHGLICKVVD
jgi:hypothetical protein